MNNEERRKKLKDDLQKTMPDTEEDLEVEEAFAKLADLFANDKYIDTMAILKKDEEAHRAWMMYCMGQHRAFRFLLPMVKSKLKLSRSVGGAGSAQVVKAIEAFGGGAVGGEEKMGLTDRIKGVFSHRHKDFVSQ